MNATATAAKRPTSKLPAILCVRCPPALLVAAASAADRAAINLSAYVRGAVLKRLEQDGIKLEPWRGVF
jgi:hypothetical protein